MSYHGGSLYKPRLHGPSANTTDLGGQEREGSGREDGTGCEKATVQMFHHGRQAASEVTVGSNSLPEVVLWMMQLTRTPQNYYAYACITAILLISQH